NDQSPSRRALLLAARTPGLDAGTLRRLAEPDPSLELLERPEPSLLAAHGVSPGGVAWLMQPDHARIDADLRWLDRSGVQVVSCVAGAYPELLRHSPDPPAVLFVRGAPDVLSEPQLAMVGSRNPSAGGR